MASSSVNARPLSQAVAAASAVGYTNAGTVEFIVGQDGGFYFLEMNTRLQVEHPVTEFITGLDLVEWQIRIARGEPLSLEQSDLHINGHAIELRVSAEDPMNDFLPSVGRLDRYRTPSGAGIRVDDGYSEGMEVPIFYDPLLAKLVVHGATRAEAIQKMKAAIADYEVEGVSTTLPFGRFVMDHPAFNTADFDTNFIKLYYTPERMLDNQQAGAEVAAKLALHLHLSQKRKLRVAEQVASRWQTRTK